MPLSNRKDDIDLGYITHVIKFEPNRPVWMLKDVVGSKLVLKREEGANPAALEENARILGAIDKSRKPVVCSATEIGQIQIALGQKHYKDRFGDAVANDLYTTIAKPGGTWIKLPFVDGLTDLETVAKNRVNSGDKSGVRAFADALNAPNGCEKLGEIVAFDLFCDSADRFHPQGGGLPVNGYNPQVLVNVGNVFAAADGSGTFKIEALDTWDPNGSYSDLNQPVQHAFLLLANYLKDTPNDRQTLKTYATSIAADINAVLGPRDRAKIPKLFKARTDRLKENAGSRIYNGMLRGADKIKQKVKAKPAASLPQGVQDRIAALGW